MHTMSMIFSMAATIRCISASAPAARSLRLPSPGSDLRDVRAQSRPALSLQAETYGILTSGRPIRNRKLTRVNAKSLSSKEANMLDVAFVALGLAALALMGLYALALRRL
jgi:hypothetical protein